MMMQNNPPDAITPQTPAAIAPRLHLTYLDGLRGAAALYVSIFHCWQGFNTHIFALEKSPSALSWLVLWAAFGRTAVSIFIVLSGYVLMIPVVRSAEQTLRGGIREFLVRRARRILPAYYAALVIAVPLALAFHYPVYRFDVMAHLLLVQNLRSVWLYTLDVPMWSVAVEWQIYFVFALLLLPVWKRFGALPTVATAFTLVLLLHVLTHGKLDDSSPWYLGLFSLGMLAAEISFSRQFRFVALRSRLPWLSLSALFVLCFLGVETVFQGWGLHYHGKDFQGMTVTWQMDLLAGLATACLVVGCTHFLTDRAHEQPPLVLRLLTSRALTGLGAFSYSYYLIHVLVLYPLRNGLDLLHLSSLTEELILVFVGIPAALIVSYGFYHIAEKPLLSRSG